MDDFEEDQDSGEEEVQGGVMDKFLERNERDQQDLIRQRDQFNQNFGKMERQGVKDSGGDEGGKESKGIWDKRYDNIPGESDLQRRKLAETRDRFLIRERELDLEEERLSLQRDELRSRERHQDRQENMEKYRIDEATKNQREQQAFQLRLTGLELNNQLAIAGIKRNANITQAQIEAQGRANQQQPERGDNPRGAGRPPGSTSELSLAKKLREVRGVVDEVQKDGGMKIPVWARGDAGRKKPQQQRDKEIIKKDIKKKLRKRLKTNKKVTKTLSKSKK